jgi:MFS family permease
MDLNRTPIREEEPLLAEAKKDERKVYDFEGLISAAGGFGRMQIYCLIIWFLSLNGANFFSFTLSFLEIEPKFLCGPEGARQPCKTKDVCDEHRNLKPRDQWEIDWDNSIHNWMTDMEMYCLSSFRIGLFGSLWLFGFAFWGILLKLGDTIGRKPILVIGCITNVVLSFALYFINNIYARYALLFLYGVTWAKVVWTYIYVTELSPQKAGIFCWGVINCTDIIALIPTSIYFLYIHNQWKYFYIAPIVIAWVTCPFIFYIPESPKFLYEKGKYAELRKVIKRIARVNRVKMNEKYVIDRAVERASTINIDIRKSIEAIGPNHEEVEAEKILHEEDFSILEELKKPIVTINLIICSILFIVATFNYYMINFYLKYAGGNLFWEVILSTISENIAYNVGSVIQSKIGTKKGFVISFASSMITALPLIFWYKEQWVVLASVFLSRFGIAASFTLVYYVNQEIFPALFVPFSFTVCNFLARLLGIAAPQIAEIPKPFPVLSFIAMGGIAVFSILFLRKVKPEIHDKFDKIDKSVEISWEVKDRKSHSTLNWSKIGEEE